MKYLLDTHIALWALGKTSKLNKEVKNILLDSSNQIYYSSASVWELEIKHLKRPDLIKISGEQFSFLLNQANAINIVIKNDHINQLHSIKPIDSHIIHNDPFGELLLAQAIKENMILITADKKFNNYKSNNIMVIS